MKKRAFISFDFENDLGLKNLLAGQAKLPDSPFEFLDWSVKEPFSQATWVSDVRSKIKASDVVIVLIGNDTHKSLGVLKEISIANQEGIPVIGIYEKGKNYYVPGGLKYWYPWTWDKIKSIFQGL